MKKLGTKCLGHQQWHEDGAEQCGHAIEDECAAIDEEKNRRRDTQQSLHNEVTEDLNRGRERRHRGIVAGCL